MRGKLLVAAVAVIGFLFCGRETGQAQEKEKAPAKKIAIRAGRLIDGKSDTPIANALILVEGEKIVAVRPGGAAPAGGEGMDLSKAAGLPGPGATHTPLLLEGGCTPRSYHVALLKQSTPHQHHLS